MKLILNEEVISSADLKDAIEELKDYRASFRHQQIRGSVTRRSSNAQIMPSSAAEDLIRQARQGKQLTIGLIEDLISELEKIERHAAKVRIILASAPTPGIKKKITSWIRENISGVVLVDFRYDSSILGGMILILGSHIYDWSFRRDLLSSKDKLKEAFV